MIEVSHLSKQFGTFRAVDDVSFSIPTGQIVGLLGPNGAGKSTTMRMITGFLQATDGEVLIDGLNIEDSPVEAKRKIGYMPESAPLYGDMIVEDYLTYIAQVQNQDPAVKIPQLCDECGLREVMHKNISELSRGYKQRVGLAHALMNDPEILILDEPTSGLDPNQIEDVRALIRNIGKTRTVIISTHILSEVETLCSRVIIIAKGRVIADSPTDELRTRYGNSATIFVQASPCTAEELKTELTKISGISDIVKTDGESIKGDDKVTSVLVNLSGENEVRPEIARAVIKKGWTLYELSLKRNSLEDVFHTLTMGEQE